MTTRRARGGLSPADGADEVEVDDASPGESLVAEGVGRVHELEFCIGCERVQAFKQIVRAHARLRVVLLPLSDWPSRRTLMVFFLRFRRSASRSILSILSLRFLASCSWRSLPSRSA